MQQHPSIFAPPMPGSARDRAQATSRPPAAQRFQGEIAMAVTIGLPFFNCGASLHKALRSVFSQTYSDWELILVDDGSSDGSREVAAAVRDRRVRLVADGENRGLAARLNQIAELARNELVCRMDGDDLAHPERLRAQVDYMAEHRGVDVLGTQAIAIDAADEPTTLRGAQAVHLRDPRHMLRSAGLIHPSIVARVDWLRRHPYDPAFVRSEDHELWVRACASSRFEQIPRPLYFYRESGTFNLGNYRRTCETDRRIALVYGPTLLGPIGTAGLLASSHLKELCYRALSSAGRTAWLVERRGMRLSEEQERLARETIATILKTPVPGLD
jgi:glycosyltransferase involved in cell wall biosynthesis